MQPAPSAGTRERILLLLKTRGPMAAGELAHELDVTPMAVRQHLTALEGDGCVAYEEERRPVGRPVRLWRVTEGASSRFPEGYAELAVGLIGATQRIFGEEGVERLLEVRLKQQAASYRERMPEPRTPLSRRVAALARIRSEEGYMAEWSKARDGGFTLVENHCPVCVAARVCPSLCRSELELFQRVLGRKVAIERTEHMLDGDRRCAYRIQEC